MINAVIIDDDKKIGELLVKFFNNYQIEAKSFLNPIQGVEYLRTDDTTDIIILDIMMPEIDGIEACKMIRKFSDTPIIMLTARGETTDKIIGLEVGADDYLAKPFEPRELVARIQTILRRVNKNEKKSDYSSLVSNGITLDLNKRVLIKDKEELSLTTMEFDVMKTFMENAGTVLSRDDLMDLVKGVDWNVFDRSIDIAISRIRKKIGDSSKEQTYLKTVWGTGYIFTPKVEKK